MEYYESDDRENREPCYVISIAANMLGIPTYTLRYYEKIGIIEPSRSRGNTRLYSESDIALLRRVKTLVDDMGVNLAGVEVILHLMKQMKALQEELERMRNETGEEIGE
jgi:MerR family transcriptional regulator, heat shock protein HspR